MTDSPAPPRAFGTGGDQTGKRCVRVPLRSLPRPWLLESPIESLPGVGPATARLASRLGLRTIADLLEHLPFDHRDYESRRRVSELALGEESTLAVTVRSSRVRPTRRRRLKLLECEVADSSGLLRAVWFNQEYLLDQLTEGREVLLRGKLESRRGGPVFRVLEHEFVDGNGGTGRHTTGLVPVYPATEGLSARRIRDFAWRVRGLERQSVEALPAALRAAERLPARADALAAAHFPRSISQVPVARRRLAFEELCLFQLALVRQRRLRKVTHPAERLDPAGTLVRSWLDSLGFELTGDQRKALRAIDADLGAGRGDAAAAGRGSGIRQDRGRPLRDAACRGGEDAGGADGADRDTRGAALLDDRASRVTRSVRRLRDHAAGRAGRPADRFDSRTRAA